MTEPVCPRCNNEPCRVCGGTSLRPEDHRPNRFTGEWVLPVCTYCYGDPCPDCGRR